MEEDFRKVSKELSDVTDEIERLRTRQCKLIATLGTMSTQRPLKEIN